MIRWHHASLLVLAALSLQCHADTIVSWDRYSLNDLVAEAGLPTYYPATLPCTADWHEQRTATGEGLLRFFCEATTVRTLILENLALASVPWRVDSLMPVELELRNTTWSSPDIHRYLMSSDRLTHLLLERNGLQLAGGLPPLVTGKTTLRSLVIRDNDLSPDALPADVSKLVNLERLELTSVGLSSLSTSLCGLGALTALNLSSNAIAGWPDCVHPSLKEVDVSHNLLAGLEALGRALPALEALNASHNDLRGALATGTWPALKVLDVSWNNLTSVANVCTALPSLATLHASHNALQGVLVTGTCPALKELEVSYNSLTSMGSLCATKPALEAVDASHNLLQGSFITGSCPALKELDISSNALSSLESHTMCTALPALEVLRASHNFLYGSFFTCDWPTLKELDLSDNAISSILSYFFCEKLPSLTFLNLASNAIYGPLPPCIQIAAYGSLTSVQLNDNFLSFAVGNRSVPGDYSVNCFSSVASEVQSVAGVSQRSDSQCGKFCGLRKDSPPSWFKWACRPTRAQNLRLRGPRDIFATSFARVRTRTCVFSNGVCGSSNCKSKGGWCRAHKKQCCCMPAMEPLWQDQFIVGCFSRVQMVAYMVEPPSFAT